MFTSNEITKKNAYGLVQIDSDQYYLQMLEGKINFYSQIDLYKEINKVLIEVCRSDFISKEDKTRIIGNVIADVYFNNQQYSYIHELSKLIPEDFYNSKVCFYMAEANFHLAKIYHSQSSKYYLQILKILKPMQEEYADIRALQMSIQALVNLGLFYDVFSILLAMLNKFEVEDYFKVSVLEYSFENLIKHQANGCIIKLFKNLDSYLMTPKLINLYARSCLFQSTEDINDKEKYLKMALNIFQPLSNFLSAGDSLEIFLECSIRLDYVAQVKQLMEFVVLNDYVIEKDRRQSLCAKILDYLFFKKDYQSFRNIRQDANKHALNTKSLYLIAEAHRVISLSEDSNAMQNLQSVRNNKIDELSYCHGEVLKTIQQISKWWFQIDFTLCAAKLYFGIAKAVSSNDVSVIESKYICYEIAVTLLSKYLTNPNCTIDAEFRRLYISSVKFAKEQLDILINVGCTNTQITNKLEILKEKLANFDATFATGRMSIFYSKSLNSINFTEDEILDDGLFLVKKN